VSIDPSVLIGRRNERWRFDLLTLNDTYIRPLRRVVDGKFDFSIHNTIRSGGDLTCAYEPDIDWLKVRIQPWYILLDDDDETELAKWPMGVFIPESPGEKFSSTGASVELQLYDKLLLLSRDEVESTWVVPKGTDGLLAVRQVIESVTETQLVAEDLGKTIAGDMVWDVGETKLRIINDLLESMNYFSLWVDGYGRYRTNPYIEPMSRGLAWEFVDDRDSIYSPDYEHKADYFNAPNKVILIGQAEGDEEAPRAVALNENPESPLSFQNRGTWISYTEQGVEADSLGTLQAIAQRRLAEKSQVTSSFTVNSAHIPLELNGLVRFVDSEYDREAYCVLQSFSVNTQLGSMMELEMRRVVET